MARKRDLVTKFAVKFPLKGQYDKHPGDKFFNFLNPALFPGPNLRRNVIQDRYIMLISKFGNPQIESGIINQDNRIGFKIQNILPTKREVFQDRSDVHQDFCKSHKCQIPVVLNYGSSGFLHALTSPRSNREISIDT